MAENTFSQDYPLEMWNRLLASTLKISQPNSEDGKTARDAKEDPWLALIDRMWQSSPYSKLFPVDPAEILAAFQALWINALRNPVNAWLNYNEFLQRYTELWVSTALKFWGYEQNIPSLVEPEKNDKRFNGPDWNTNPVFNALKQTYLLAATTLLKTAESVKGLDEHEQRKVKFYMRQFADSISPTNYTFTNPQVLHETIQSGGQNLATGMQNLLRDLKNGQIKMTDTDAFEVGRNLATTPGQVIYRNRLVEIIQYNPTTEKVHAIPILFLPHWINKFYILDLQPNNSLIKFLVDNGFSVFVISWKNPDASMEDITFEDYLELGALKAFEVVKEITGSKKINAVGYCIGGTLLSMVIPYLAEKGDDTVNSATFFVALQDFTEVGDTSVFVDEPQIAFIEGQMLQRGYLDSRQMASMFNMLRDNDLIWSNVVNNYLLGKEPPAFDLLFWNNDGTRMAPAAHSFYLRNTYLENNLIKPGKIVLKGVPINLGKITQDVYSVGAIQDHIVPWKSAWSISKYASGNVRFVLGGSGHIAGVISPPNKGRDYWINETPAKTAEEWFEGATKYTGHWWPDWLKWLEQRSGEMVKPPTVGNKKYKPLVAAPGTYVKEK